MEALQLDRFLKATGSGVSFGESPPGAWLMNETQVSQVLEVSIGNWLLSGSQDPRGLACAIDHAIEIMPREPGSALRIDPALSRGLSDAISKAVLTRDMKTIIRRVSSRIARSMQEMDPPITRDMEKGS